MVQTAEKSAFVLTVAITRKKHVCELPRARISLVSVLTCHVTVVDEGHAFDSEFDILAATRVELDGPHHARPVHRNLQKCACTNTDVVPLSWINPPE